MKLKCRIAVIRELNGRMTQEELSMATNIAVTTISRYENDAKEMKYKTGRKIAKALGCPMDDLYEEVEE